MLSACRSRSHQVRSATSPARLPLGSSALLLSALLTPPACAAELRIEEIRLGPAQTLELHFPAEPNHYYRLLRGPAVTSINTPAAVILTGPVQLPAPTQPEFFRVQQIPRANALDSDGDGRDDVDELLAASNPLIPDALPRTLTSFTSSPADGEADIAVTRETVLWFDRPLAPNTVLGLNTFFAEAAGRRLLTRAELSPNRQTATLFYLEPLPGGAQVQVTFDGDRIRDFENKAVDADRNQTEGGVGFIRFTTLNNQSVPGTAVIGRVFASELVPGTDTGTNALNRPLAGVTITVDGMEETLRTVTDAQGNFKLTNAPAGRFFVHVDGRTAVGSQWPLGDYYPFVGKAWEAVAGLDNNLAGGTGEIYLPLIQAGALQPVSPTAATTITFPSAVLAANPALAGVEILVPAGALFDDNGTRGGRLGIAPVPPDRLPEPLPDDLNFPLVITIQTDGPRNFAQPVPVRFPNLPDPSTGLKLPPGAKTALWSFDHDKGYWEVVGPATVTADGNFVETDPGVGVLQPGWHGVQPGTNLEGGPLEAECDETGCIMGPILITRLGKGRFRFELEPEARTPGIVNWFAPDAANAQGLAGNLVEFTFCAPGTYHVTAQLSPKCGDPCSKSVSVTVTEAEIGAQCDPGFLGLLPPETVKTGELVNLGLLFLDENDIPEPREITWTATGANPATGRGLDFRTSFCTPGPQVIRWSRENPCGTTCADQVTLVVTPNPCSLSPLEFNAGQFGPFEISTTNSIILSATASGGGSAVWDYPGGQNLPEFDGGPVQIVNDHTPSVGQFLSYEKPGTYTVTVRFTNRCGETCEQSTTIHVTEPPCALGDFYDSFANLGKLKAGDILGVIAQVSGPGTAFWDMPGSVVNDLTIGFGGPSEDPVTAEDFRTGRKTHAGQSRIVPTPGTYTLTLRFVTPGGQECSKSLTVNVAPAGAGAASAPPPAPNWPGTVAPAPVIPPLPIAVPSVEPTTPPPVAIIPATTPTSRPTVAPPPPPPPGLRQTGLHYYLIVDRDTGRVLRRGRTGRNGIAHPRPLVLPANRNLRETILQADTFWMASKDFRTGENGSRLELGTFRLQPPPPTDTDGDGLPDAAELVVGGNPDQADTDRDGVRDAEEVRAGTPVQGATAEPLGLVHMADTPGYAWDVALAGQLAAVADGTGGVSIFNIVNPESPALVGQRTLPGEATTLAASGNRLLVGLGSSGAAVLDLESLPNLSAPGLQTFDAPVTAVAAVGQMGFVGLASGRIVTIDLGSGAEFARTFTAGPVEDLAVTGGRLFALTLNGGQPQVTAFQIQAGQLNALASGSYEGARGAGGRRLRLGTLGNRLYAVHTAGVAVFEILPFELRLVANHRDGQFGWRQLAPDARGGALAASDPASTADGAHDVQQFDLQPNGDGLRFDNQIPTPGSAESLTLSGNFAFVADGLAGLAVLRHAESDRLGRPPTVTLRSPFPDSQAEEGRPATFAADATDDVGLARVEFLVDGVSAGIDAVAPYELTITLPRRAPDRPAVQIQARATDTGGNVGLSPVLTLTLTGDSTPPAVSQLVPASGTTIEGGSVPLVGVILNEPINPATATPDRLALSEAGPDGQFDTPDDVPVTRGSLAYRPELPGVAFGFNPGLPAGRYRATLQPGLADPQGNRMGEGFTWTFEIRRPRLLAAQPAPDGKSAGLSADLAFSSPMSVPAVASGWRFHAPGPDAQLGTADDTPVPGTLVMAPGTAAARMEFSPPLTPGRYRAQLAGSVADSGGNTMGADLSWDFTVAHVALGSNPLTLTGSVRGPFAADEYLLEVDGTDEIAVSNPNRLELALRTLDGAVLWRDSRDFFKVPAVGVLPHVLRIAKGDGDFTQNYNVQCTRIATARFTHILTGTAAQEFVGRPSLNFADTDEFELRAEPGATYFVEVLLSSFNCSQRASIFDPAGQPVLLDESICSSRGVVVTAPEGGAVRVRIDATRSGTQARVRVTKAQERSFAVTLSPGQSYQTAQDAQFSGQAGVLNPGDVAAIAFTIPPGARFSFTPPPFAFSFMPLSLLDPNGQLVAEDPAGRLLLPDTSVGGVFTLRMPNNTAQALSVSLQVQPVLERPFGPFALVPGAVYRHLEGSINGPGSRDVHLLQVLDSTPVAFATPQFAACHNWELVNAAGQTIFGPEGLCARGGLVIDPLPPGEYRLIVTGTVDSTSFSPGYVLAVGIPGQERSSHDLRTERTLEFHDDLPLPRSVWAAEFDLDDHEVLRIQIGVGGEGCSGQTDLRLLTPDGTNLLQPGPGEPFSCFFNGFRQTGPAGRYRLEVRQPANGRPDPFNVRLELARQAAGQWLALNHERNPLTGPATALLVRDDGNDVFIAGTFADGPGVARRVQNGWEILGLASRDDSEPVRLNALAHDGASLYAAGNFTHVGGVEASGIARWDGTAWQPLGSGITVRAPDFRNSLLEVRDLAFVGTDLYAGGLFRESGGVATFNLSRWTGSAWTKVSGPQFNETLDGVGGQRGQFDFNEWVDSLAVLGDTLFVAGGYQFPGSNVGSWRNNQAAENFGGGVQASTFNRGSARLVRTANHKAYFEGNFSRAGRFIQNLEVQGFAAWTGTEWERGPTVFPFHETRDFTFDGDRIALGGSFGYVVNDVFNGAEVDGTPAQGVALWDGTRWFALGLGLEQTFDGTPLGPRFTGQANRVLISGRRIFVAGQFTHAGGQPSPGFAIWESAP